MDFKSGTEFKIYCIDGDKLVGDDGSADFYDALGACSTQFNIFQCIWHILYSTKQFLDFACSRSNIRFHLECVLNPSVK